LTCLVAAMLCGSMLLALFLSVSPIGPIRHFVRPGSFLRRSSQSGLPARARDAT
jgi:hypothetical protein